MSSSDETMFKMDCESPSSPEDISMNHQATCHILESILGPSTQMELEIQERAMKHVREIGEERKRSSLKRRLMMRLRKDGYDASLCRSSWVATTEHPGENAATELHVSSFGKDTLPKSIILCMKPRVISIMEILLSPGDYEYIDVLVAAEGGAATRLVVDIDFRSQFEVARPAPWYAHLWSRLPPVFVGPRALLRKAVSLLCAAAQRSLRESGLQVPPWRRSGYMHAKWLPCGVTPTAGTPAAAVAQWSVATERGGGARRSGGLSMELSGAGAGADVSGCQAGSMWA
ncbi:hypothetical protein ACP70R_038756 [Stipagrostis hirtigluma subsp. patula]